MRIGVNIFRLTFLFSASFLGSSCIDAQTLAPPAASTETSPASIESSQDCRGSYTATQCTAENTKFLGAFDLICILAIPGLFLFAVPLAIGNYRARAAWWRTSPLQRWLFPMCLGVAAVGVAVLAVPFLPQVAPISPESGLLKYLGVDADFINACDPCRTRVTNRSPFYGLLPTGMPQQGLAPQYPYVLGGSIVFALFIWSALYICAFMLIRKFKGLEATKGGAR